MKKKITAIVLCIAMATIAIAGASLAYFTDQKDVNNTFSIGDIEIDLWENYGGQTPTHDGHDYTNLMPTDELVKQPVVENTGDNEAYVRVAVVMNHVTPINEAIDDVYEAKGYTDAQIQAVYDKVFNGWGLMYTRRPSGDPNVDTRRMWMSERDDEKVLFDGQIDMYCNVGEYGMFDVNNTFKSATDTDAEGFDYDCAGYYRNAAKEEERVYVFYLKLEAGESYKLFDGLNVPADFTADQMAMFDDLQIDVYADAIQTTGFDTAEAAFEALQAEHALGYWN